MKGGGDYLDEANKWVKNKFPNLVDRELFDCVLLVAHFMRETDKKVEEMWAENRKVEKSLR